MIWLSLAACLAGCGESPTPDPPPPPEPAVAPAPPTPAVIVDAVVVPPVDAGPFEPTDPRAFVHCVEVEGVVVVADQAALDALPRRDGPGCAKRAPPEIDFEEQKLVLFGTTANCDGAVEANDAIFQWSQWGDCDAAVILRAQRVIAKDAPTPTVEAAPWHANEAARLARFGAFAALVRKGDVGAVRGFIGEEGVRFVESPLEGGEPRIVERTRESLTRADLTGTHLYKRKLTRFRCHERGDEVLCLASGENYMNGYHLSPQGDGFTVRAFREATH
jgi:hypothetical protein